MSLSLQEVNAAWDQFSAASRALKLAREAAYRKVEQDLAPLRRASEEAYKVYHSRCGDKE